MPKRVESDEEDSTLTRKRTTRSKGSKPNKAAITKPQLRPQKTRNSKQEPDSVISAWAKRQQFPSQEVIEDVEVLSPQEKGTTFSIEHRKTIPVQGLIQKRRKFLLSRNSLFTRRKSRK
jgi:hypothetical protein